MKPPLIKDSKPKHLALYANLWPSVASVVAFCAAIWLAVHDKTSSATVCATLSVACFLLGKFQLLDNIEVLGLKAKLRSQISEADSLLDKMKGTAEVLAEGVYFLVSGSDRPFTDKPAKDTIQIIDKIEKLLDIFAISDDVIASSRQQFITYKCFDLAYYFSKLVAKDAGKYADEVAKEIARRSEVNKNFDQTVEYESDRRKILQLRHPKSHEIRMVATQEWVKAINEYIDQFPFSSDRSKKWKLEAEKVIKMQEEIINRKNYTLEAEAYIYSARNILSD